MKSYLKFLSRNKLYASIEVLGLSLALAFVIILVSYASMEYRVGASQRNVKELYVVGSGEDLTMTWGTAREFFPSISEIKEWTRLCDYYAEQGVMVDGKYFTPKILAVDPNFLQVFNYKLKTGLSRRFITDEHQVVVSESFAKKVFGSVNPIGRTIKCDTLQWKVVGVMEDVGDADVLQHYDIFVSMKLVEPTLTPMNNFGQVATVVRLAKDANPKKLEATLLNRYMKYWQFWTPTKENGSFTWGATAVRWDKVYFSSSTCLIFRHGNQRLVNVLLLVACVLLLSAIFNYINLTVAQIGSRAKEMAVRRLLGEQVAGVMLRYLKESALFAVCCFLLGGLLSLVFVPLFDDVLDTKIALLASDDVWLSLLAAYLLITLLSGVFPAIVVSRLNPIEVVKGTVRLRSKMWFGKTFIVVQNVISMTLVVVALTMTLQMHYLSHLPMGYHTADVVQIFTSLGNDESGARMSVLLGRLKALPECEEVSAGGNTPINMARYAVYADDKKTVSLLRLSELDSTAMKMLGFKVLERYSDATDGKLWISREAKRAYGISSKNTRIGCKEKGGQYEVCGVIGDYHSGDALTSLEKTEHNVIMVTSGTAGTYTVLVKTCGDHAQALCAIRKTCRQVAKELTGTPSDMQMDYLDDMLAGSLKDGRNMMMLILIFMGISILISALGLFGMSVYYGNLQKRQIALRRVMGGSVVDAAWQLSRRYLVCSLVAVLMAVPVCVKLVQKYLMDFAYRIDFPWWVLLVGAGFVLLLAFCSVIGCTLRTALSNPIDSIKTE